MSAESPPPHRFEVVDSDDSTAQVRLLDELSTQQRLPDGLSATQVRLAAGLLLTAGLTVFRKTLEKTFAEDV